MIQAALLSKLGVVEQDVNGFNLVQHRDANGLNWLVLIHAEPGGSVTGQITRCDPGTMGRTLFHFRATSRDGRHGLDYVSLYDVPEPITGAALPPLPALCALVAVARAEMDAGRVPDLQALIPLHLGLAFALPAVELRPGDREIRLHFEAPE